MTSKTKSQQRVEAMTAQRDRLASRLEAAELAVSKAQSAQADALAGGNDKAVDASIADLASAEAEVLALESAVEVAESELSKTREAAAEEAAEAERQRVAKALNKAGDDLTKAGPALDRLAAAAAEAKTALEKALPAEFMPVRLTDDSLLGAVVAMRGTGIRPQDQERCRDALIGTILTEQFYAGVPETAIEAGYGKIALPLTDLKASSLSIGQRNNKPPLSAKVIAEHFTQMWKARAERVLSGELEPTLARIETVHLPEPEQTETQVFAERPFTYVHPDQPSGPTLVQAGVWTTVPIELVEHAEQAGVAWPKGSERAARLAEAAWAQRNNPNASIGFAEIGDGNVVDLGNPLNVKIAAAHEMPNPWEAARGHRDATMAAVSADHPLRTGDHLRR